MGQNQAIGSSRGGLKTKIVALLDALGNLSRFVLLPGQRHDSIGVEPLIMRKLKNRLWSVALVAQIEVIKAPQVQLTAQLQSTNERPTSCQHPRHLPPHQVTPAKSFHPLRSAETAAQHAMEWPLRRGLRTFPRQRLYARFPPFRDIQLRAAKHWTSTARLRL